MISGLETNDSRFVSITAWALILVGITKTYYSLSSLLIECSFSFGSDSHCGSLSVLSSTLIALIFGVGAFLVGLAFLKDRDARTSFKFLAWLYLVFALGSIAYGLYSVIDIEIPWQASSDIDERIKMAQLKSVAYMTTNLIYLLCQAILVTWSANRIIKMEAPN